MPLLVPTLVALLGALPPPLPPTAISKCKAAEAAHNDQNDPASYRGVAAYLRCIIDEEKRIQQPGYKPTPEEAAWIAERDLEATRKTRREAQQRAAVFAYLVLSVLIGLYVAWRTDTRGAVTRRWSPLVVYLIASTAALASLTYWVDTVDVSEAVAVGAVAHIHWGAVLLALAFRRSIIPTLRSGWGRLFVVVWVAWAGWFVTDLLDSGMYESDILRFTTGGVLLPVALALAIRWVVRGFQRPKPEVSS